MKATENLDIQFPLKEKLSKSRLDHWTTTLINKRTRIKIITGRIIYTKLRNNHPNNNTFNYPMWIATANMLTSSSVFSLNSINYFV